MSNVPLAQGNHADSVDNIKKRIDQNNKYKAMMVCETLDLQLTKTSDMIVLNFRGDKYETHEETLKKLTKVMKSSKKLCKTDMSFRECEFLTDKSLLYLTQGLKVLYSLQGMKLDFYKCEEITDEGLKNLAQGLKSLSSLRDLNLSFGR